jgi:hypothetical protein
MNSQEELMLCLWQLAEALAPNCVRRLSIVRDGDAPSVFCAACDLSDAVSETSEIIQQQARIERAFKIRRERLPRSLDAEKSVPRRRSSGLRPVR